MACVPNGIGEYYPLARDTVESARLNRQHRQFENNLGFVIHPSIPITGPNLRIADFGTGTGIWLIDVAKKVSPTCQLNGFDISGAQFPDPSKVPSNVTFLQHDLFKPLPEQYWGTYDIIQARALCLAMNTEDWEKAVSNFMLLLKPGGRLQWVDFDGSPESFRAVSTKPRDGISALEQGIAVFHRWADMQGRKLDDCKSLPDVFKQCGLEEIESKVAGTDSDVKTRAECSHTMIVTLDRLFNKFAKVPGSGITSKEVSELVKAMRKEAEAEEHYMRIELIAVVGRKPVTPSFSPSM